jgi:hypothetical protein
MSCGGGSSSSVDGDVDVDDTVLSAPKNVKALAGDEIVRISWDAVTMRTATSTARTASSYNMYMATEAGVTKANYESLAGSMVHVGIKSPFDHPALVNGTTYYFVITALDGDGESVESNEVSATPMAG